MLRQLPPTVTADQTPDWLPIGWVAHSTLSKRGRPTRTYTHLRTGKKLSTKDQVLEYEKMVKIREKRESVIERKKLKAFQDREAVSERERHDWQTKLTIDSFDTMESQDSRVEEEEEMGCNQISYIIEEGEEELSETEYVGSLENVENITSTSLRSAPERLQKLESRAKTKCVFEEEETSSDSGEEENAAVEEQILSTEKDLRDVVVECADKTREVRGLTGSLSIEINLEREPASDSLIGTRNIEDRDLMHISASSKVVEVNQETGDKREEPLKAQEEDASELRRSVFFPCSKAPLHSVLVFDKSNARSSPEDLSNIIELGLNTQEENMGGSKKRKKNMQTTSSKNIKKKDIEAPNKKLQKGKKGSSKKKHEDWPEPFPNFPFEPIASSSRIEEEDTVIRRYLEQHFLAKGNADSNLPLPDFGLPSFSNLKISLNEEPESKKDKSPNPPCVQVASSSLPSCSSMQQSQQTT